MDIIMVRHGQTEDNIKKIFSRDDTKLTEQGIKEIEGTKLKIKNFDFQKVYYSPLKRTVETLNVLGIEGIENKLIREIDFGIFTGHTFNEITEIYPIESKLWVDDSINYRIPKGESLIDVYDRIVLFMEEIKDSKENILLVVHDCVIRLILCWIFDNPDYFFRFKVDNGSISVISIDNGFKYIKKVNY